MQLINPFALKRFMQHNADITVDGEYYCGVDIVDRYLDNCDPVQIAPLTLCDLRFAAKMREVVLCEDENGISSGLLCIRESESTSKKETYIWLLDKDGEARVFNICTMLKNGAKFYKYGAGDNK